MSVDSHQLIGASVRQRGRDLPGAPTGSGQVGLTPRGSGILSLIARGREQPQGSPGLYLSINSVQTCIRSATPPDRRDVAQPRCRVVPQRTASPAGQAGGRQ